MLFHQIMTFLMAAASFMPAARAFTAVTKSPLGGGAGGLPSALYHRRHATAAKTVIRAMSSTVRPPMPFADEKMPFYALGVNLALQVSGSVNLNNLLDEEEVEVVLQAFCDQIRGTALADSRTVLTTYGPTLNQILNERNEFLVDRIKQEGAEFIANFLACNEEAVRTQSGLIYYEMKAGTGTQPNPQSTVEVHYHGTLIDGTVFDSSVDRGQTIRFPLGAVIPGWQEGLQLMKEGGKATLVIPSELGYGDQGSGDTIPPGATLVFEVELFQVS